LTSRGIGRRGIGHRGIHWWRLEASGIDPGRPCGGHAAIGRQRGAPRWGNAGVDSRRSRVGRGPQSTGRRNQTGRLTEARGLCGVGPRLELADLGRRSGGNGAPTDRNLVPREKRNQQPAAQREQTQSSPCQPDGEQPAGEPPRFRRCPASACRLGLGLPVEFVVIAGGNTPSRRRLGRCRGTSGGFTPALVRPTASPRTPTGPTGDFQRIATGPALDGPAAQFLEDLIILETERALNRDWHALDLAHTSSPTGPLHTFCASTPSRPPGHLLNASLPPRLIDLTRTHHRPGQQPAATGRSSGSHRTGE